MRGSPPCRSAWGRHGACRRWHPAECGLLGATALGNDAHDAFILRAILLDVLRAREAPGDFGLVASPVPGVAQRAVGYACAGIADDLARLAGAGLRIAVQSDGAQCHAARGGNVVLGDVAVLVVGAEQGSESNLSKCSRMKAWLSSTSACSNSRRRVEPASDRTTTVAAGRAGVAGKKVL